MVNYFRFRRLPSFYNFKLVSVFLFFCVSLSLFVVFSVAIFLFMSSILHFFEIFISSGISRIISLWWGKKHDSPCCFHFHNCYRTSDQYLERLFTQKKFRKKFVHYSLYSRSLISNFCSSNAVQFFYS